MLPEAFLARMRELLGGDYPAFLAAYDERPARALHTGRKMTAERLGELLGAAVAPTPFAEDALYRTDTAPVGGDPLHHAGAYYMQEPSAMLPVLCAEIRAGERVLDLCAAPGGKSTQIANRIGDGGLLVSNEYVPNRCVTLAGNLERMGVRSAVVTRTDAPTLAATYPGFFDAVVIDAPCSGEGMFRREEIAVAEWSPENVAMCAARQREILLAGADTVRPGGRLVYSTCTFSPEENEQNVLWFLRARPDYVLEEVPDAVLSMTVSGIVPEDSDLGREVGSLSRRAYPHIAPGEGQFMCRFRRAEGASPASVYDMNANRGRDKSKGKLRTEPDTLPLSREERVAWGAFLAAAGIDGTRLPEPVVFKGSISLLAGAVPTPKSITYARGVNAGTVEKGRLCPAHFFFSAYGEYFERRLDLMPGDAALAAYLAGETFPCALADGWAVVTVAGAPVGGIKVVGGVAKNHYPKGLRDKCEKRRTSAQSK